MGNAFITPEEFVKKVTEDFNSHEIGRLFREGTREQRQEIADALSDLFGGGFPKRELGEATMTQTDQMNEMSFRSDEQAQSQDRERLQADLQEAWDRVMAVADYHGGPYPTDSDIKLLKWALGVK